MTVSRIAIVGAGPAGLATAKALQLEPHDFQVDVYDRRAEIGGLWYFHGDKATVRPPVPSTDPNAEQIYLENGYENRFFSSMYDHLETNLIDRMMEYKDFEFQPRSLAFIPRSEVLLYLHNYADSIPSGVNYYLGSNVVEVTKKDKVWTLKSEKVDGSESHEKQYDAIVVANGHTEMPYIPDTPGIGEWNVKSPGSVSHARYFTNSEDYRDKNVLIVGNYASGVDLATQISVTASHVHVSVKDHSELVEVDLPNLEYVGLIEKYEYDHNRSAVTVDGTTIPDIDTIVFATGYLYTFKFLESHLPGITDGKRVQNIYRQIFNVDDPTLAFVGLPKFIVPMALSEAQAAYIARIYSGRLTLPGVAARRADYEAELAAKGDDKPFHYLKPPLDSQYCNNLHELVTSQGVGNEGLVPIFWGEQKIRDRAQAKEIKDVRYFQVAEHARKLRERGTGFFLPPKSAPIE